MSLPLDGRVVALAETRQLEELAALLAKEGATPLRYPLVSIIDADDARPVVDWLRDLAADRFGTVVFMTGEGVRRLLDFADRAGFRAEAVAALGRTRTLTRGPKPVAALRENGLQPTLVAAAPTTDGVVATLAAVPVAGTTVGVQFHGDDSPAIVTALETAGAAVRVVRPYRYAPAADGDRVAELVGRMAAGGVDVLVLTSSPQTQRLFDVAGERRLTDELRRGLERTRVAAVGPVAAESLAKHGVRVDIVPEQGFVMKNLVVHIRRALAA